jgi:hypothetical protein
LVGADEATTPRWRITINNRHWYAPAVGAFVTTALGVAINLATDLRSNALAWLAVVVLTIAGFVIGLGADRTRRARRATETTGQLGHRVSESHTAFVAQDRGHITVGAGGPVIVAVGAVVMLAVVVGLIGGAVLSGPSNSIQARPADTGPTTSTPGSVTTTTTTTSAPTPAVLGIATAWPFITGCAASAEVAMPPGMGKIEDFHAVTDIRPTLVASGAGSWTRGLLYIDLSAPADKEVEIINIQPHIERRDLAPPAWIYRPDDGCGPSNSDRMFNFDLDKPSFVDDGLYDNSDAGHPPSADMPKEPLGPGFVLAHAKHARIRVNASSCHGNYEWNLDIQYATPGSNKIEHKTIGPFQSFGVANNTKLYSGYQDTTGSIHVEQETKLTGSEPNPIADSTGSFFSC